MDAGILMFDKVDEISMLPNFISGTEHFIYILINGWLEMLKKKEKVVSLSKLSAYTNTLHLYFDQQIQQGVSMPNYLRDFARSQSANLAKYVIQAILMQLDRDYFICSSTIQFVNCNTVNKSNWQHVVHYGLLQFLQIKHKLAVSSAKFPWNFISTTRFFELYQEKDEKAGKILKKNVYGFTEALGSLEAQEHFHWIYHMDFLSIPSSKPKLFSERDGTVAENQEKHLKSIKDSVIKEIKDGKSVLVICESLTSVETIYKYLEEHLAPNNCEPQKADRKPTDFNQTKDAKEKLKPKEI
uniref:SecA family profile domain-containing protein n=1 Tax=Ditylenchus dipsaci TaxID=166011 RepID=A0A915D4R5_9BILA